MCINRLFLISCWLFIFSLLQFYYMFHHHRCHLYIIFIIFMKITQTECEFRKYAPCAFLYLFIVIIYTIYMYPIYTYHIHNALLRLLLLLSCIRIMMCAHGVCRRATTITSSVACSHVRTGERWSFRPPRHNKLE